MNTLEIPWRHTPYGVRPSAEARYPLVSVVSAMRRQAGISQARLAEVLGVAPATISRWGEGSAESVPASAEHDAHVARVVFGRACDGGGRVLADIAEAARIQRAARKAELWDVKGRIRDVYHAAVAGRDAAPELAALDAAIGAEPCGLWAPIAHLLRFGGVRFGGVRRGVDEQRDVAWIDATADCPRLAVTLVDSIGDDEDHCPIFSRWVIRVAP